jgi:hypothetical protein
MHEPRFQQSTERHVCVHAGTCVRVHLSARLFDEAGDYVGVCVHACMRARVCVRACVSA